MSDTIILEVESRAKLESLAQSKGFDSIQEYLLSLVAADVDEDEDVDVAAGLREALLDVKEGRTYPVESLWDMVEANDDET